MPYVWPSNLGEDVGTLAAGLIGGGIGLSLGLLFQHWRDWLERQDLLDQWHWWPVLNGLLIVAFMHWLLLLAALVKLLMLGLCLSTCWRGGIFFPVFVVACSTGTAPHQLPSPLLVLVLGLALLQGHGAAGLLVGLACAQWLKQQRRTDGGLPLPPETPGSPEYPPPRS